MQETDSWPTGDDTGGTTAKTRVYKSVLGSNELQQHVNFHQASSRRRCRRRRRRGWRLRVRESVCCVWLVRKVNNKVVDGETPILATEPRDYDVFHCYDRNYY